MTGLVEFLGARWDEDEAATLSMTCECDGDPGPGCPSRVLADISAKRTILAQAIPSDSSERWVSPWDGCGDECEGKVLWWALRALAQPFAAHPDFDPAWRV